MLATMGNCLSSKESSLILFLDGIILISHELKYNDYLTTTGARDGDTIHPYLPRAYLQRLPTMGARDGDTIHQPAFTGNAVFGPNFRKQPQKGFTVRISAY
jgi:hypothetical protein